MHIDDEEELKDCDEESHKDMQQSEEEENDGMMETLMLDER